MKIDGKKIAEEIIEKLKTKGTPDKILAAILVGGNPESESFLKQKEKTAEELGASFKIHKLSEKLGNEDIRKEVERISSQKEVGGVIIQLPLPAGLDREYILNAIPKGKDVDALNEWPGGKVLAPAVEVVREIIERQNIRLAESNVAVLGVGKLVGGPVSKWLDGRCKKLDVIDEEDSRAPLIDADIIISGVGRSWLVDPGELKNGAGVIDFGYSYEGKLSGDLKADDEETLKKLKFYTPTPGGTGPILVAKLFENFYKLCGLL